MSGGNPRPESGLELYAWLFMRVSGLALLFLALGHLLIMHIIHNVDHIDFQFVAARYATPFWRTYDLLMLWFAMIHGVNGLRTVMVEDRKSTRLNSSHSSISYAVFCLKKK